ncbi:hypothetical protein PBR20603_00249 [Pandoraea bronchicola]|uniref:Uncharacterized protein n=1 Tax=Pandoraea bronchicola TaxID=2508287 RepID=A0A5E5BPY4_9BURK|nr:hypothetical protein PBR20603_00249 [Pandoraea bronchicola]
MGRRREVASPAKGGTRLQPSPPVSSRCRALTRSLRKVIPHAVIQSY